MKTRLIRINDEIARVTAEIIRSELSDPRIGAVVSVLKAETTNDLKYCKINVSFLEHRESETPGTCGVSDSRFLPQAKSEPTQSQKETMAALQKASGFIRKRIAEIINLRVTPEIKFIFDDSIAYGMRMSRLIEEVNKGIE